MDGIIDFYEEPTRDYQKTIAIGHFYSTPIRYTINDPVRYLKPGYFDRDKPHN